MAASLGLTTVTGLNWLSRNYIPFARPAGTAIECEKLAKRLGNFTAMDHVSFSIARVRSLVS